jgi:predicted metal-binding membrane protein
MNTAASDRRPLPASTVFFLVAVAGVCWAVTVDRMRGMNMGPGTGLGGLGWFAAVWVTMMAAMMLPSLSPMAVASVRAAGGQLSTVARSAAFAAGYLLPWLAFGVLAYAVVQGGRSLELGFLAWNRVGQYLAAGVILGAARYELTAAKRKCLRHCRDSELLRCRPGLGGAVMMGVEQGGFCVGCSGALMAALFAVGVMSIPWMFVIATLVAVEKLLPWQTIAVGSTAVGLALLGATIVVVPAHVPWLTIPVSMVG